MKDKEINRLIAETFSDIADGIINGSYEKKVRIGLTAFNSEHGVAEIVYAAVMAQKKYKDLEVVLIAPEMVEGLEVVKAESAEEGHRKMLELLDSGILDGCVTQHFDFPLGVSTVGRIVTPAKGREVFIATTTGIVSTNRVESMIKNAISGIAVAKTMGIEKPKLGILNIDGARAVERALEQLKNAGYEIHFADSLRSDGGCIMRGNDLLAGTADIVVCDSLTGNLLVKVFASFTTGGDYEISGAGYGPGISDSYSRLVSIVSRASGAPIICEALRYCADCAKHKVLDRAKDEYARAYTAGMERLIHSPFDESFKQEKFAMPPKKVVTNAITGIDILELENACEILWKEAIYSESGMGCTGPIVLVHEEDAERAKEILRKANYIR